MDKMNFEMASQFSNNTFHINLTKKEGHHRNGSLDCHHQQKKPPTKFMKNIFSFKFLPSKRSS